MKRSSSWGTPCQRGICVGQCVWCTVQLKLAGCVRALCFFLIPVSSKASVFFTSRLIGPSLLTVQNNGRAVIWRVRKIAKSYY
jgi:hypothetical protein